jgi:hypothetical protein
MKSIFQSAAVAATLLLVSCANAVPPVPAPRVDPYLSFLDGNAIHTIDGTRTISIHPASAFPTSSMETLEVTIDGDAIRFTEDVRASANLEAHQGGYVLVIKTLSDERDVEPQKYQTYEKDLIERPSAVGTTTTLILAPSGKCLSEEVSGGAATTPEAKKRLRESPLVSYLTLASALGQTLHQGQVIDRNISTKTRRTVAQFTVQGYGSYRGRSAVVLTFFGTATEADGPKAPTRLAGFIIVDMDTGITSYLEISVASQTTRNGTTTAGTGKFTLSADLSAIGHSL